MSLLYRKLSYGARAFFIFRDDFFAVFREPIFEHGDFFCRKRYAASGHSITCISAQRHRFLGDASCMKNDASTNENPIKTPPTITVIPAEYSNISCTLREVIDLVPDELTVAPGDGLRLTSNVALAVQSFHVDPCVTQRQLGTKAHGFDSVVHTNETSTHAKAPSRGFCASLNNSIRLSGFIRSPVRRRSGMCSLVLRT